MESNRKVICAGCDSKFFITETSFYRNKRWCGHSGCKDIIDLKVKHANYKKAQKKMFNGTFRHGVEAEVREYIKNRDDFKCRLCMEKHETLALQVHHIVPVANGGDDDNKNLVLLCYDCHTNLHKQGWEKYSQDLLDYVHSVENLVK